VFFGGGTKLLINQVIAVVATFGFSFVVSFALGAAIEKTLGLRISEEDEFTGLDQSQHAEAAYQLHDL
jgi:ammonium transporter, Amt family